MCFYGRVRPGCHDTVTQGTDVQVSKDRAAHQFVVAILRGNTVQQPWSQMRRERFLHHAGGGITGKQNGPPIFFVSNRSLAKLLQR